MNIEWHVYQLGRKRFLVLETIGDQVRSYKITDKGEFKELEAFLKQRREAVLWPSKSKTGARLNPKPESVSFS